MLPNPKILTLSIATLLSSLLLSCTLAKPDSQSNAKPAPTMGMEHGGMQQGSMDHSKMMSNGMNHNMDLGPADADYDLRFIDGMMPHHEGAIVMAQEVLKKSQRPEMKKLAENIIKAQTDEIAMMKQWRKDWYPKAAATPMAWHGEMKHMTPMPAEQMKSMRMDMDLGASDDQFDLRFMNAMIPHHEGALVMAKDAAAKSQRPEIQKAAQAILSSQTAEIQQMKQWRKNWYKQ
jgi:uncharacterized protein (DUF305 family)